ncbi:MAG: hypothetical protein WCJ39_00025 [bacterium]
MTQQQWESFLCLVMDEKGELFPHLKFSQEGRKIIQYIGGMTDKVAIQNNHIHMGKYKTKTLKERAIDVIFFSTTQDMIQILAQGIDFTKEICIKISKNKTP